MNAAGMVLVPLTSVLIILALGAFGVAGYYGFRLTRLTGKMRVMIMVTQEGPSSIVGGIAMLALSEIMNLVQSYMAKGTNFFDVTSEVLVVGSGVMFALGFQKMYSVCVNERLRTRVYDVLEDLSEIESKKEQIPEWQGMFR